MPTSIASLFASAGLAPKGSVRWMEELPEGKPGVYVLSLTGDTEVVPSTQQTAPIDTIQIDRLIATRRYIQVDREPATSDLLKGRLSSFWLPKESILYIGRTKTPLRSRVGDFYRHTIGDPSPHAGGWWVKMLACLPDVHVHYSPTGNFVEAEETMLRYFIANAELPPGETSGWRPDGCHSLIRNGETKAVEGFVGLTA